MSKSSVITDSTTIVSFASTSWFMKERDLIGTFMNSSIEFAIGPAGLVKRISSIAASYVDENAILC